MAAGRDSKVGESQSRRSSDRGFLGKNAPQLDLCRAAMIVLQQPAQPLAALDWPVALSHEFVGIDDSVVESLVVPFGVIVLGELLDRALQHPRTKQDHPVETLFFDRADEPLGIRIEVGTARSQIRPPSFTILSIPVNGEWSSRNPTTVEGQRA